MIIHGGDFKDGEMGEPGDSQHLVHVESEGIEGRPSGLFFRVLSLAGRAPVRLAQLVLSKSLVCYARH